MKAIYTILIMLMSTMLSINMAGAKTFMLPALPYTYDALEPYIGRRTMELHHSKHLQAYVNNLNTLIKGTKYADESLEEIVKTATGAIFNNAGQVLNHTLYFNQFSAAPKVRPTGKLYDAINKYFGSYDAFVDKYNKSATSLFGSGWVWLAVCKDGSLIITQEINAGNPLSRGHQPLLGCDVWEHAYYLDYQNQRADHISAFWKIVDWRVIEQLYDSY